MEVKNKKCFIHITPHETKGWEFELRGECRDTLMFVENLPPSKRRYLERRLNIRD